MADGSPDGSRPFAVLSDHFDEPDRRALSGRIAGAPGDLAVGGTLRDARSTTSIAAPRSAGRPGFEPVLHPHAGTYIETADEIARVMDADRPLAGRAVPRHGALPVRWGGSGPGGRDYRDVIRHVHIKDCRTSIMDDVKAEGGGLDEALRRGVFCPLGRGDSGSTP